MASSATQTKPERSERWLDAVGVAAYLGVSLRTVRSWTMSGEIPHVRTPGRLVRYDSDAIDRWLEQLTVDVRRMPRRGARGTGRVLSAGGSGGRH